MLHSSYSLSGRSRLRGVSACVAVHMYIADCLRMTSDARRRLATTAARRTCRRHVTSELIAAGKNDSK